MEYIKLQLGCLLIIIYLIVSYMKATKDLDNKNYIFNILMFVAPFAVFFDGLTAWNVNHFELVRRTINLFSIMFFSFYGFDDYFYNNLYV